MSKPSLASLRRVTRPRELSWLRALVRRIEQAEIESSSSGPSEARDSAQQHLRWLREEAIARTTARERPRSSARRELVSMVHRLVVYHEPLSYIIGTHPFGELQLDVRPPVLIPRQETEDWVMRLAGMLSPLLLDRSEPLRILEVGTGSGCISLLLAAMLPRNSATITSMDIDTSALSLAGRNADKCAAQLRNPVHFELADVFDDPPSSLRPYHLLISNPPYIPAADYASLPPSVRQWESRSALVGERGSEDDGLAFYRRLASLCATLSTEHSKLPRVVLEIDAGQAADVSHLLRERSHGAIERVEVWQDASGHDRVVVGYAS